MCGIKRTLYNLLCAAVVVGMTSCAEDRGIEDTSPDSGVEQAVATITASDLLADIEILASDDFEGRAPSSAGEEKTVNFLRDEFRALGLMPGNGSSFFQDVPLIEITADPDMTLSVDGGGATSTFQFGDDFVSTTRRVVERSSITQSELVFVGFGVDAPELDWNDWQGMDFRGKTVIVSLELASV